MQVFHRIPTVVALVACATVAEAQVHLNGRVIDDASEQPIIEVSLVVQDARGRRLARQVTDEQGRFSFVLGEYGPVRLQAERVGYQSTLTPVLHLDGYTLYRVEVRMDVAAVPLAPLEVVTRSRTPVSPTLVGFERRRQSGTGWFMTREEIGQRNPDRVSDILTMVPGVAVHRRTVYMTRGGNCPAQIFVDGFHINRPVTPARGRRGRSTTEMFPIDEVVRPSSIHGIEVYQGLSKVPAEFYTPGAACGVVAIWTRRGG